MTEHSCSACKLERIVLMDIPNHERKYKVKTDLETIKTNNLISQKCPMQPIIVYKGKLNNEVKRMELELECSEARYVTYDWIEWSVKYLGGWDNVEGLDFVWCESLCKK